MGFVNPILGGGGALVRPAIKSPNFVPGVSGWSVNRSGDAEFNDLTVRGTYEGAHFVITDQGMFFYDGIPSAGTLIGKWSNKDSYDPYGNVFLESGITLYSDSGTTVLGGQNYQLLLITPPATPSDPAEWVTSRNGNISVSGAVTKFDTATSADATWNVPVMGTGWATGPGVAGAYPPLRWRLDAEDNVHIFGTFHATATNVSGVMATGFPHVSLAGLGGVGVAGNAPKLDDNSTQIPCYVNETGQFRSSKIPTVAVNDTFLIAAVVPLGNLA